MNPLSCRDAADLLDEMALGTLPGDHRSAVLDHLAGCSSCREEVAELSSVADALLLACPPVRPPDGFERRVKTAIDSQQRRYRPRWALVAAVAAAVMALSGGAAALVQGAHHSRPDQTRAVAPGEANEMRTVKLIAPGGLQMGDVSAYDGSPAGIFLRVDRGTETDTYQCVLDVDGGRSVTLGTLSVSHGKGAWGEHIAVDASSIRAARIVDAAGSTVAIAIFP